MFCGNDENTTFPAAPPQVCRHNNRLSPSGNNAQQHGVADQIEFHHGDLSRNSNPAIIETLLEAGANAKAKDKEGKTAIDYAKENEKIYKTKAYWKLNDALYE